MRTQFVRVVVGLYIGRCRVAVVCITYFVGRRDVVIIDGTGGSSEIEDILQKTCQDVEEERQA